MWHSRPPRDPHPPFMANAILNFHFDYWNTSLIDCQFDCFTIALTLFPSFVICSVGRQSKWKYARFARKLSTACLADKGAPPPGLTEVPDARGQNLIGHTFKANFSRGCSYNWSAHKTIRQQCWISSTISGSERSKESEGLQSFGLVDGLLRENGDRLD